MKLVPISSIAVDSGTQIRAAIDQQVVADYAEAMTNGAEFPPIVLFHDGSTHHVGDGFHRLMAAQRNAFRDIPADVRAGTQQDALWFALGANRENGKRLTEADKSHAIEVALKAWPERLHKDIASQIGCSESLVSKVSSRFTSESGELTGLALANQQKRDAVVAAIEAGGKNADEIAGRANVSKSFVSKVRAEMGLQCFDRSKAGVARRRGEMREMAGAGYTSRQIASKIGISEEFCRATLKAEGIDVPADKAVGKTHRHDSNRILSQIVMDAENLTEGTNLIDFSDIDRTQIADWLRSLQESRNKLGAFIRKLTKEQQNGEAA